MWQSRIESVTDGRVQKYTLVRDDNPIPYCDVLSLWQCEAEFRSFYIALLADSPFAAYRWETPPISSENARRDFEFVLVRSDRLDRPVDRTAFASHFANEKDVVTFTNLGGDALMVAPCPIADESIYGHLSSFIRNAPEPQVHHFWQSVGEAMQQHLDVRPVWLSTAGMGVSWLHVRLDSRPKYYFYAPYKQDAQQ